MFKLIKSWLTFAILWFIGKFLHDVMFFDAMPHNASIFTIAYVGFALLVLGTFFLVAHGKLGAALDAGIDASVIGRYGAGADHPVALLDLDVEVELAPVDDVGQLCPDRAGRALRRPAHVLDADLEADGRAGVILGATLMEAIVLPEPLRLHFGFSTGRAETRRSVS